MASANSFVEPKNTEQHPEVVEPDARIRVAAENLREDSLGIGHLAKLAVMACSISTTSFRDAPARRKATVRISGGFRLRLKFDDGTERDVDVRPFLRGPIFEPLLRDTALFAAVRVDPELGTIVWPNGADIDPDTLHAA